MTNKDEMQIDLLDIINGVDQPKEQKEQFLLDLFQLKREWGEFIYEGNNIVGFKFYQSMESLRITLTVEPDGITNIEYKNKEE